MKFLLHHQVTVMLNLDLNHKMVLAQDIHLILPSFQAIAAVILLEITLIY
jgi:hypothetical protein